MPWAFRPAEVLEVPEARLGGGHEEDVVVIVRAEVADVPRRRARVAISDTGLPGSGHNLLQWGVAGHCVGHLQGWSGSAHPSSMEVAARLPSL